MDKSKIFIISGPSGAGEDSIIEGLRKNFEIERVITTSTRQMRSGESQGNPYYFISREEFIRRRDNNEFIEWAEQYNGNLYGVTKEEIERVKNCGKVGIWKIDWKGVITAKKLYPEIPAIFITVSDFKILEDRIRRRGGISEEYIKEGVFSRRFENDARQIAAASTNTIEYFVSWNFRHIVKVKTRRMVNLINLKHGYKMLEIITPSEL